MRKFLTMATLLLAVAISTPVLAQTAADPASCGATAARLLDNVGLRLQQYNGQTTRESIKAMLQAGINAAASGNETSCWVYVKRARQY
jgi:hypothetical protein